MRPISTGLFFFSFVSGNAKVLTQLCGTTYNISNGCTTSCLRLLLQNTAALGSLPPTAVPSSVSESPALGLYHILCVLTSSFILWCVSLDSSVYSGLGFELSEDRNSAFMILQCPAQCQAHRLCDPR